MDLIFYDVPDPLPAMGAPLRPVIRKIGVMAVLPKTRAEPPCLMTLDRDDLAHPALRMGW